MDASSSRPVSISTGTTAPLAVPRIVRQAWNPSTTGINTDKVILTVWLLGGALAGLSGVIFGLDEQVQWNMGTRLLLLMFAAITLGGLGRPFGALIGALVVGIFVQLWAWWFGNFTDLKNIGALAGMILVLLFRPQGILGKKERIG